VLALIILLMVLSLPFRPVQAFCPEVFLRSMFFRPCLEVGDFSTTNIAGFGLACYSFAA